MGNGDVTRYELDRRALLRLGAGLAAPAILPRAALAQGRLQASVPTLAPATVQLTERAVAHYENILARGGWPQVPVVERLQLGNRHQSVAALRTRLIVTGDLDAASGVTDIFDSYVENAVRHFQVRHGIPADGVVREQTFAALNIPCELRVAQLQTNAVRLRSLSGPLGERYVLCNLPGAQIEAIENGIAVSRHTAVVGKPDRPSPNIVSKIVEINFNPFWTVPVSIVQRDLIKKMQDEPDYLEKNRIRIFDMRGHELAPSQINWYSNEATAFMFRQDPGDQNSLGAIRINFPSKEGVYMHDTPLKNLFGEDMRFHSSGCVRVENVRALVDWLLRDTAGWARQQIDAVIRSGERKDARLARTVPVYWVYITAWAASDGAVQFREDIYNHDGLGPFAPVYTGSIAR